jgi:hypothetical protein
MAADQINLAGDDGFWAWERDSDRVRPERLRLPVRMHRFIRQSSIRFIDRFFAKRPSANPNGG